MAVNAELYRLQPEYQYTIIPTGDLYTLEEWIEYNGYSEQFPWVLEVHPVSLEVRESIANLVASYLAVGPTSCTYEGGN